MIYLWYSGKLTVLQTSARACNWFVFTIAGVGVVTAEQVVVVVVILIQVLMEGIIGTGTETEII